MECKNAKGERPPDADRLRDIIANKYIGKPMTGYPVMTVAEMAISGGAGQALVFDTVNDAFNGFEPSEAHRQVSDFKWRAVATTNYDLLLERAYDDAKRRRQVLIPFVKDDEPIDSRKNAVVNPVEYIKLHGCLNHRLDKEIPLVLSWEDYDSYEANRTQLFGRLGYLAHECPIIFVGYRLADLHIRKLLYKLGTKTRPRWYVVDPAASEEDIKFWNGKNFDVLKCRFGEFMTALDTAVPKLLRFLTPSTEVVNFPLRVHYSTKGTEESDNLRASLAKDLTLVHASMGFAEQTPERFYSGYDTGWGGIINRYDARRKVTDDLLFKALLEAENPTDPIFFLLRGPAGAGKTIALKRAAFDMATSYSHLVLWLDENGRLRPDVFQEIHNLVQKPIYLYVDQVALHVDKLIPFLRAMRVRHVPIVLIGAEREADWTTYCGALEQLQTPQFLRVGRLSSKEVEDLLDLLERNDCLGELKGKDRATQVAAFMSEDLANKQLLVALHQLTRGYPFEKIVLDEYERVPEKARRLYLDIATMHQFAVPVRAGTISRVTGIHFREYEAEFLAPLKDMVLVTEDEYSDWHYRTRHPSIAAMIFMQVCEDDAAKAAQFIRLIEGFDIGFSSDRRTLQGICKGRVLARQFQDTEGARDIFAAATTIAPNQGYLLQQWAIFEAAHLRGDILDAERLAAEATMREPRSSSFIHTQAEVARRRANLETSPVLKEQLRRNARRFLDDMPIQDRLNISSRCKLLVDEISDLTETIADHERTTDDRFLADKLHDAETSLRRAQQLFPEDAQLVETEARLWNVMKDKVKILRALERAWKKMPRGSGTAIRISKIHAKAGRTSEERKILDEALVRDPEDKSAHFAMAMHLLTKKPDEIDKSEVVRHLGASFSVNDSNFEERFSLAQYFFATGEADRARELFGEIERRAPSEFRKFSPRTDNLITSRLPVYSGSIESIRAGFFFLRSGSYPDKIFAHRSAFEEAEVDDLEFGQQMYFRLRFNRRGPVAVVVHSRQSMLQQQADDTASIDFEVDDVLLP